jgi:PST family polysaccharide transporter
MEKSGQKKLLSNFAALGIVQGSNFLIPLVVMPYLIGRIGADGFGEVSIAQVVMTFFITISDYGFNLTATREVALHKGDTRVISKIFFSVLATKLLICLLLFLLLLAGILCIPFLRANATLYLLSFVTVVGQTFLINWLFQGIERMKFITYITLLARIIYVVLVFTFIRERADNIYFIFFTGVGNLFAGLLSIWVAFKLLRLEVMWPTAAELVKEMKNGWHIMVSNLSVSIYMYVNVLVLRVLTNDTAVGYYSIAEKVVVAARQLLGVYFQAIYPQVCQLAIKSKQELHVFLRKNYLWFLACVGMGGFILLFFPEPIVHFFIKENEAIPSTYLRIMSFVPFIVCLNIPAYQILLAFNEKRLLLRTFFIGTLLNIALNLLLVDKWGALGTCYVVLITESFITAGLLYLANRDARYRPLKYII